MSLNSEMRIAAIDQCKMGGDPMKAIALALLYVGDCVEGGAVNLDVVADAVKLVATEIGG